MLAFAYPFIFKILPMSGMDTIQKASNFMGHGICDKVPMNSKLIRKNDRAEYIFQLLRNLLHIPYEVIHCNYLLEIRD